MLLKHLIRCFGNNTSTSVGKRFLATSQSKLSGGIEPVQADALDKDICILIDEKDNFTGVATKRDCHKVKDDGKILLHRAFSVFLFNKRGDILLQKRSNQKVTYSRNYTNSCCSHPLYIDGKLEDVVTAARRRLNFELGIPLDKMDPEKFSFLTRFYYQDPGDGVFGEHEITHILLLQDDFNIKPNSDEISEYCFVAKNEFNEFIKNLNCPLTPWFNMIQRHRLMLWWDNLHRLKEVAEPDKIHKFLNEK